ncbi:MAG TPA: acetate--CoA ligase family protein [Thermoplasmata archaeon]|nr:acetate--CoA ligase family protein [Thermoplasmata archaeon]
MSVPPSSELSELFCPRSVAVIGASNRPGKVGTAVFQNILRAGFQGVAYPVNPSSKSISGVRCYPDVPSLPEAPDLGVVIVPAPSVAGVVDQLGKAGTKGLVVITAGFREVGEAGAVLEAELVRRAVQYHMSLIGPNCFGIFNTHPDVRLNSTFSEDLPNRGNIAFVSQSGALCAGILAYGAVQRIGFSRFVSVGNRAGVDENDLLYSLGRDPATRVILLYVESLANGRRFLETAVEVTEQKPVLVIKSGRTPAGERAVLSHTGSLAQSGRDQLYDSIFAQSGVLRADSLGDLFRMAKIFSTGLTTEGPRLAILTNSGGPGIVAADAAIRYGLELPPLPPDTRAELAKRLPSIATISNPVDVTAEVPPEGVRDTLTRLLAIPDINAGLVIVTPAGHMAAQAMARAILEVKALSKKPIVACLFGLTDMSEQVTFLDEHGIPAFTFPEEAAQGLGSLARYHAWTARPRAPVQTFSVDRAAVSSTLERARTSGVTLLPEYASRSILSAYGIPFVNVQRVGTVDEAAHAAESIGYPVVLKVASPDISHKTDVGGVAVGIEDAGELRVAWDRMQQSLKAKAPTARIEGFEIETEVRGGKEVLIGVQRDPSFGPIVVFGLGGIYVEVMRDVAFRLAPLRPLSAQRMIESIKSFAILQGVRGEPPSDVPALADAIQRVSQLAVEIPEVVELDINPLIVRPAGKGVVAVDARIVLAPSSKSGPTT